MGNFKNAAMAAALSTVVVLPMAAEAATISVDPTSLTGIGDEMGSTYDQLDVAGNTFDVSGDGVYTLTNVTFTAGLNSFSDHTFSGSLPISFTLDANGSSFLQTFTGTISNSDSITLDSISFSFGGYDFLTNALTLSSDGTPDTEALTATISASAVPEPASWAMMVGGFGLMGATMRRRKTTVSFA